MSGKSKTIDAAKMNADNGSNELWVWVAQRDQLRLDQQQMLIEFNAMVFSESKKELGRKIDLKNREISALTAKIKEGGRTITSEFRGVAGKVLPKHIYSEVLHQTNCAIRDPTYECKIVSMLTSEEEEYIIKGKAYDTELKSLKDKISMAKRRINELMPNFLGALDKDEYDARLNKTKELKSILKELL